MKMRFKGVLFAAVAAMGVVAFGRGTKIDGLANIPAIYWIENESGVVAKTVPDYLADGVAGTYVEPNVNGCFVMLDFGSPRKVRQLVAGSRDGNKSRLQNFKIAGSNDRQNWTVIHSETANDFGDRELIYIDVADEAVGPYRYIKFYNFNDASRCGNITEAAAYTDEPMIWTTQANPFAANGVDSSDDENGVKVTATLLNAGAGTVADIEIFASQTDCGADYAAWAAAFGEGTAVKTVLDDAANDVACSGFITGCAKKGRWYWKAFADLGNGVRAVGDYGEFSIGTEVIHPLAYAANTTGWAEKVYFCYDGDTVNASVDNGHWYIVFDLGDMPAGKHLEQLRIWPRIGREDRTAMLVVDFGSGGDPNAWNVTGWQCAEGDRKVASVSGVPDDIVWTTEVEPFICATYYRLPSPTTVTFHGDTIKSKPRYLRLRAPYENFNFCEVEIRVADDPDDVVKFVHTATPSLLGTPDVAYGDGLLAPGEETTVTMASDTVETGTQMYVLDGYTLSVSNKTTGVVTPTEGTETVCTFTPEAGTVVTLAWHWTTYGKIPADVRRYENNTLNEVRDLPYQLDDNDIASYPTHIRITKFTGVWDFGSTRDIAWMRFASRGGNYGKDIKFYGSNVLSDDPADWTLIYDQDGVPPDANSWIRLDFNPLARYRYIKATDVQEFALTECQFWSKQTLLTAQTPCTWSSTDIDSPLPAEGVAASAKLSFTTNGSEHIIAYAAHTDYGDDIAAWAAHAEATSDAGMVKDGYIAQFRFAGLANGVCHWRAFAIDPAGHVVASQRTVPFLVGTVGSKAKAYLSQGSNLPRIYDGKFDSYPTTSGWIVFDLKSLPAGYRPAVLRIWTRTDASGWQRLASGEVRWGYSDGTEEWNATEVEGQPANRPLFKAAAYEIPGITWGATSTDNFYNYFNAGDSQMEYLLPPRPPKSAAGQSPRYLFFQKVGQEISLREIELRLMKNPGMAIIVR